jgi:dTMP kinase
MRGKLIIIEGTDCSGKQTQTDRLFERLDKDGIRIETLSFPMYDTPTGRIVGGPYLGKSYISNSWFPEGSAEVDAKVSSLYYAADRKYNVYKINKLLNRGINVILDRYTTSNMGHQAGKISDKEERLKMYKWIEELEYNLLELPRPDIVALLYMPYKYGKVLRKNRLEQGGDGNEVSEPHLRNAEKAYLELAELYNYKVIDCVKDNKIRTIDDIHEELYNKIKEEITN